MPYVKDNFHMAPVRASDRTKKYYARVLASYTIMVVYEKHTNRYFKTSTLREFCAACLSLLDERWGPNGGWDSAQTNITEHQKYRDAVKPPVMTVEALKEKIPLGDDDPIVQNLKKAWEVYEKDCASRDQDLDMFRRIADAIENRNGLRAAQIMRERQTHEYERWEFERIEYPLGGVYEGD